MNHGEKCTDKEVAGAIKRFEVGSGSGPCCPTCEKEMARMHNKKIDGTVFYCEYCWNVRNQMADR